MQYPTAIRCSGAMSMVRQPIGPTAHWSENPLVRRPIGPKKCHWSEKVCHWSENPLVRKSIIGPKIAGTNGRVFKKIAEFLIASG